MLRTAAFQMEATNLDRLLELINEYVGDTPPESATACWDGWQVRDIVSVQILDAILSAHRIVAVVLFALGPAPDLAPDARPAPPLPPRPTPPPAAPTGKP